MIAKETRGVHLTEEDKEALASFLHCFTDSTFISTREFSTPFKD